MKILKNSKPLKNKRCVAVLGTFDGVHLGHRKVMSEAVGFSKKNGLSSVVVTFDPHPQSLVHPEKQLFLLTTIEERAKLISDIKPDFLFITKFNKSLRSMSYRSFVKKVLVGKLNVSHVFAGMDYAFGRNKEGNIARLKRLGRQYGFGVTGVRDKFEHHRVVKSTLIRNLIAGGQFGHAIALLGHPYIISGKVVKGRGTGRKLGYPTANIDVPANKLVPRLGVYACRISLDGKVLKGVVNIGKRPTFKGRRTTIEVFIFNFKRNVVGKNMALYLEKRIRDEKRYPSKAELVKAIKHDAHVAKEFLM